MCAEPMTTCILVMERVAEWDMWILCTYGQGVRTGTCAMFICSLSGSVLCSNQLSSIFWYSGKYHRQYAYGLAGATWPCSYTVVHILLCFWGWMLSGETVRCSDISSFPCFHTHSGFLCPCSPHKSAFRRLALLSCVHSLAVPPKSAYGGRCPFNSFYSSSRECMFSYSLTKGEYLNTPSQGQHQ